MEIEIEEHHRTARRAAQGSLARMSPERKNLLPGCKSVRSSLAWATFVSNARPRSFNRRTVSRSTPPDQQLDRVGISLGDSSIRTSSPWEVETGIFPRSADALRASLVTFHGTLGYHFDTTYCTFDVSLFGNMFKSFISAQGFFVAKDGIGASGTTDCGTESARVAARKITRSCGGAARATSRTTRSWKRSVPLKA